MSTVRFLFDEDVDQRILRGLRRREPAVDILTVQDAGLTSVPDADVLRWAARHGRVLVTQDVNTMTKHLFAAMRSGLQTAGVLFIPRDVTIAEAIEDLLLVWAASTAEEWAGRYDFLPLTPRS